MSTSVAVNTYVHTVNYVATKLLHSLQQLIRLSGLDPAKLIGQWDVLEAGISTWLSTQHLRQVTLEIFSDSSDELVLRWDFDIKHKATGGDGSLWTDTDALRYAIDKAGMPPSGCNYRVLVDTAPGAVEVKGWSSTSSRSTAGFKRYGVGATIGGDGISADASYWRKR